MSQTANDKIKCEIDGAEVHYLPAYIAEKYGMTVDEYLKKYPNALLESPALRKAYAETVKNKERNLPPSVKELTVEMGAFEFPVNWDVPAEACLPLPDHYRLPAFGNLGDDIQRALRYLFSGRSTWIWGPAGSGKDAFPSALCALTRTPSLLFPVNPDVDIQAWFYDKSFNSEGTHWEYGELFNALVYGYVSPISGRRIPMTIVMSDFDRAGRSQAEAIRLVADTIQGRVKGPRGETYPVLPGTQLIFTANTMGAGDVSGKYVSANVLDVSILERIERKVRFHSMDWRDEEHIIKNKFPLFAKKFPSLLAKVGDATAVLRKAVENQNLYGEFSHRGLCTWIGDCEDIIRTSKKVSKDTILAEGFHAYADGLPDATTKTTAQTLITPYTGKGALPSSNNPVQNGPLKI